MLCVGEVALAAVRLDVSGADADLERNIRAHAGPVPELPAEAGRRYQRRLRDAAVEAAHALGYYQAKVEVGREERGADTVVQLRIEPGARVTITDIDLKLEGAAAADPDFQRLAAELPLKEGDPLHHGRYEDAKLALHNLALRRGYLDAKFTEHRVEVDAVANTARIQLSFDSGPRYLFGEVSFSESPLDEALLRRLVPFAEGEAYQAEQIIQLNRNLLSSRYFATVQVRPRPEDAVEHRIPVDVLLTPQEPNKIGVGLGYSTDVGPRLRLNWQKPYVNSEGHSLGADSEFSQKRRSVTAKYQIPLTHPLNDFLQFQSGYQFERFEDSESESFTAAALRERLLDSGWRRSLYVRWQRDQFVQGADSGTTDLVLPGVSLVRTRSRGGIDPDWGDRLLLTLEATDDQLGSDIALARLRLGARFLQTFADKHGVFLRADLGSIWASRFSDLPPSLRFFAGGDQSIRGFDYNTVAPRDETGALVGGRYLLTGSVEYDYAVAEKWRLAVFVDAGNAMNSFQEPYKVGTGFGVHWISPVGSVRLDLAWGVSEERPPFELHFTLGPRL